MRRVLVTGSAGYLGGEVVRAAEAQGLDVVGTWFRRRRPDGVELDVRDAEAVRRVVIQVGPDAIIHAAYVQGGHDLRATTAEAPVVIATAALEAGVRLVHVSTDLVFDGDTEGRYDERDEPRPVMPYGEAKAAAERGVRSVLPEAVVARASLIYGGGQSHQERLVRAALDGSADVAFFTDEIRTPVEVSDLASALLELAVGDASSFAGVIHLGGTDAVSRFELASLLAGPDGAAGLRAGRSADTPGRRPLNCALDSSLAASVLRTRLRGVREVVVATRPPGRRPGS